MAMLNSGFTSGSVLQNQPCSAQKPNEVLEFILVPTRYQVPSIPQFYHTGLRIFFNFLKPRPYFRPKSQFLQPGLGINRFQISRYFPCAAKLVDRNIEPSATECEAGMKEQVKKCISLGPL